MPIMLMLVVGMLSRPRILLFPVLLSRQILLAIHPNIHFSSRNSAAHHARYFQLSPNPKRRHGLFQEFRRNSGIHQRAQKHVAADAGKTLKVGYAHRKPSLAVRRWSLANSKHPIVQAVGERPTTDDERLISTDFSS